MCLTFSRNEIYQCYLRNSSYDQNEPVVLCNTPSAYKYIKDKDINLYLLISNFISCLIKEQKSFIEFIMNMIEDDYK